MTESVVKALVSVAGACEACGASLRAGDTRCWLCGAKLPGADESATQLSGPTSAVAPAEASTSFSLSSMMMFVTLVSVLLGTISIAPGLGIPLAFVAFFAWISTAEVVRRRAVRGLDLTPGEKALLFVRSFVSTVALLAFLAIAAGAALATALYTACALGPNGSDAEEAVPSAFAATLVTVVAIFVSFKLIQYKRRRWRSEFSESDRPTKP